MLSKYKIVPEIINTKNYYVVYKLDWILFIPIYKLISLYSTSEEAINALDFLAKPTVYV